MITFAEEIKVVTSESVASPHTSCDMRVTRSTHAQGTSESLKVVSPVLSKRSTRRAFKVSALNVGYVLDR
jgi:hypothetical protein